jgi:hypothetical protein
MVADEDTALSDECELKQCDCPSHFESAARVTECSAEEKSRSVRCACKIFLTFAFENSVVVTLV